MNRIIFIALILLLPFTSVWGQRKKKKKEKQTQKVEMVEVFSSADYPYIEKFHQALREKISKNYKEAKKLLNECLAIRQDDDAIYFALAEIATKENNSSEALKNYQKAYELDKDNVSYLQEYAFANAERADFEQAEVLYLKLIEKDGRDVDYRYGYIRILIYNKKYAEAISQIDVLQGQVGMVPELSNMKADLQLELKDRKAAEETMLALKKEYPDDLEVLKNVIGFYEEVGEQELAIELIKELAKNDPDNGVAYYVLATYYIEFKDYNNLAEVAPKVFKSEDVTIDQKLQIYDAYAMFTSEVEAFEITEAMYLEYPDNTAAALNFGNVIAAQGKTREALKIFSKALEQESNNIDTWVKVLFFESRTLEYNQLYIHGMEAVSTFPSVAFLYLFAAEGAMFTNRLDEAPGLLATGEMYVMDDPKLKAHFNLYKGLLLFLQKDFKKGIVEFEKALSTDKNNSYFKIFYARALANANIATDVAEDLLKDIPKDDQDEVYFTTKAKVFKNKKKLSSALEILNVALQNTWFFTAEIHDLYGDYLLESGLEREALEEWNLALLKESRNKVLEQKIKERKYYAPKYY